jgi:hypothetical protein
MSRLANGLLAASLLLVVGSAAAGAAPKPKPAAPVIRGLSNVAVPNARLAAFVDDTGQLLLAKGVAAAARTGTGVYCVVPSPSLNLNLALVIPAITADFLSSIGDVNIAEYAEASCQISSQRGLMIRTFNGDGGPFHPADVAFTIIIP